MRSLIALLACVACSTTDEPPVTASVHRDCAQPIVRLCSGLATLTPTEPISYANALLAQPNLLVRAGDLDVFEYPALLQRFAIDGLPPRLHATSNTLLEPAPSIGSVVTDGVDIYASRIDAQRTHYLTIWSSTNKLVADVAVSSDLSAESATLTVFRGLALVETETRLTMIDTSGATVWSESALGQASSYGCGFAFTNFETYTSAKLLTMPLDGRARLTQSTPGSTPWPWPYDSHAIAFATPPVSPFDAAAGCVSEIDVVFDDGRPALHRELATDCYAGIVSILPTPFGAVFSSENQIAMLDENANIIGELLPKDGTTAVVGNYIAAVSSEWSPDTESTLYSETVFGCAH